MKFASLRDGTPDGALHVVAADLSRALPATDIVPNLRAALDDWDHLAPAFAARAAQLARDTDAGIPFAAQDWGAPLPRCFQWLDGSAFLQHAALMTQAFGMAPGEDIETIPLMYQGAGDDFLGPRDDIFLPREEDGIDFEAEFGVVLDGLPMGADAAAAAAHIRLVVLLNDVSLRGPGPREMRTGFGFLHAKPATSFAPVAITPDELGPHWRDGRVHLPVHVTWNDTLFGTPAGGEMRFSFAELAAHAAWSRHLRPGTVIGSGTISNADYARVGSACIAERRAIEMIAQGRPQTEFLRFGDRICIIALDEAGHAPFGGIDQRVRRYVPRRDATPPATSAETIQATPST